MNIADINITDITTPEQLKTALSEKQISHGEAMLILLHRIDPKTVGDWVDALTPRCRADFKEYARARAHASRWPTKQTTRPDVDYDCRKLRTWTRAFERGSR